jgi:hypothetical protein
MSTDSQFCHRRDTALTRRDFLRKAGGGFGLLALASILDRQGLLGAEPAPGQIVNPLASKRPHFAPRAKSVIWLFMEGGPSAVDTFDPKPELTKFHGRQPAIPIHTHFGSPGPLMKSPFGFAQYGQSGAWVSDQLPHLAGVVDDLCFIKSCWAESPNHGTALLQMNTGHIRSGYPSAGAWMTYGLGSENADLPGFVVLQNAKGTKGGAPNWGAGFLPNSYQGTTFRAGGAPILNLHAPAGVTAKSQRSMLDFAAKMNRDHFSAHPGEEGLLARIQSYELAFAMQTAATDVADLASESEATKTLYGLDHDTTAPFGRKCLLARRLVERGVRFVQVYCDDEWDAHNSITDNHTARCAETDRGAAALIKDLKQRGLLQDTLVIWGGDFGRMPVSESGLGRDHNPEGFLVWMAGGGVKGGMSYGATDEIGWQAADRRVSVPDLHATILHTLGLDHEKLTYLHNGRKFRLTDVSGSVLRDILV